MMTSESVARIFDENHGKTFRGILNPLAQKYVLCMQTRFDGHYRVNLDQLVSSEQWISSEFVVGYVNNIKLLSELYCFLIHTLMREP